MRATILLAMLAVEACADRPPYPDLLHERVTAMAPRPDDANEMPEEGDYLADLWIASTALPCGLANQAEQLRLIGAIIGGPTYRAIPIERIRQLNSAALELVRRDGTDQCPFVARALPGLRARMRAATPPRA